MTLGTLFMILLSRHWGGRWKLMDIHRTGYSICLNKDLVHSEDLWWASCGTYKFSFHVLNLRGSSTYFTADFFVMNLPVFFRITNHPAETIRYCQFIYSFFFFRESRCTGVSSTFFSGKASPGLGCSALAVCFLRFLAQGERMCKPGSYFFPLLLWNSPWGHLYCLRLGSG